MKAFLLGDYKEKIILICGGTGSGKTSASIAGYLFWTRNYKDLDFGVMAKTDYQTNSVVMLNFTRAARELGMYVGKKRKKVMQIGSNRFHFLDGANVSAAERMQGADLSGFYIDEAVKINGLVLEEAVKRIRALPEAKMIMTANPDEPMHDFYINYVMRADEIKMRIIILNPEHNPSLSAEALQLVIDTAIGGSYYSSVLGEWSSRTGLVYHSFKPPTPGPDLEEYESFYITADPGYSSSTHAVLLGRLRGTYWVVDELRLDFVKDRFQLSDTEQVDRMKAAFAYIPKPITLAVVDSAAQSMKKALHYAFDCRVLDSDKRDFDASINYTKAMLHLGVCRLTDKAPRLHHELLSYSYDDKHGDMPLKSNTIHGLDALRYFLWTLREIRRPINVKRF